VLPAAGVTAVAVGFALGALGGGWAGLGLAARCSAQQALTPAPSLSRPPCAQVSATTTSGAPLSEAGLAKVVEGCEMLLSLDDDKRKVGLPLAGHACLPPCLPCSRKHPGTCAAGRSWRRPLQRAAGPPGRWAAARLPDLPALVPPRPAPRQIVEFVESHMHKIAPNLSAVIGSETAARLMGLAGGLVNLSRMPACNIQVRCLAAWLIAGSAGNAGRWRLHALLRVPLHCARLFGVGEALACPAASSSSAAGPAVPELPSAAHAPRPARPCLQVLGSKRKNLAGFSTSSVQPHQGFIHNSAIIQSTPPGGLAPGPRRAQAGLHSRRFCRRRRRRRRRRLLAPRPPPRARCFDPPRPACPAGLRNKAVRLLAGKAALLARVDAYGQDPSGAQGQQMLSEVQAKIDKWQEPPPAKQIKPLPKPDAEIKKRRWARCPRWSCRSRPPPDPRPPARGASCARAGRPRHAPSHPRAPARLLAPAQGRAAAAQDEGEVRADRHAQAGQQDDVQPGGGGAHRRRGRGWPAGRRACLCSACLCSAACPARCLEPLRLARACGGCCPGGASHQGDGYLPGQLPSGHLAGPAPSPLLLLPARRPSAWACWAGRAAGGCAWWRRSRR
jgi:hypothetical protein